MAKVPTSPKHFLKIARNHLERVQNSWALVRAAALKAGETPIRTHWGKADQARNLAKKHGLPNVDSLLGDLNVIRKANAYGDVEFNESDYDAENIAREIEEYFVEVSSFCK